MTLIRKRKQKSKDNIRKMKRRRTDEDAQDSVPSTDSISQSNTNLSAVINNRKNSSRNTLPNNALLQKTNSSLKSHTAATEPAPDNPKLHSFKMDASNADINSNTASRATAVNRIHAQDNTSSSMEGKNPSTIKLSNAHTHIRSTAVFDFGGVCKDYKEYGWCSFGADCLYAHIREDYASGYDQDLAWDKRMKEKKEELKRKQAGKKAPLSEDDVPPECPLCKKDFKNPVKTLCDHFFCKECFLKYYKGGRRTACPVCKKETSGILNSAEDLVKRSREKRERLKKKQEAGEETAAESDKDKREYSIGWAIPKSIVE